MMLKSIRVFLKVVEQGGFSGAGRVLNMAPSSVTRGIDQLEKELGASLFKRSTRQLSLTPEGQKFLVGAEKLLAQADELCGSLKTMNAEPEGHLRVSVFETFGRVKVSPLLPEFLQRYPKVKLQIDLENRMIDLDKEDIDLAIRIGRPIDSNLKAKKLLSNQTLICASPQYIAKRGKPASPDELMQHNCLVLNTRRQKAYWHFKQSKTSRKILVSGNLISTGGTPLLEAALSGAGIVQIPKWMVAEYIDQDKLVICLEDWACSVHENAIGEVYAVYRSSTYIKPSIRAFIDFLVEKTLDSQPQL